MRKVAVIGSGTVGEVLANGFLKHGYEVMRASRDPKKLQDWKSKAGSKSWTGTFAEAAKFGEILVLAVKGSAAVEAIKLCGLENLAGKTIMDATNPISDKAPVNGVLNFFTDINFSLMETLQKAAPAANFVKAFSCVGNPSMVNPTFPQGKPTMFIAGNNAESKSATAEILQQFGWEVEDMGKAEAARAIEPLCMLWCIPGLTQNRWTHAFKVLNR